MADNSFSIDSSVTLPHSKDAYDFFWRNGKYISSYIYTNSYIGDYRHPLILGSVIDEKSSKIINEFTTNNINRFFRQDTFPMSFSQYDYNESNDKYVYFNDLIDLFLIKGNKGVAEVNRSAMLNWNAFQEDGKDFMYGMLNIDYGQIQDTKMFACNDFIAVFMLSKIDNCYFPCLQIYDYEGKMLKQIKINLPGLLEDNVYAFDTQNGKISLLYKELSGRISMAEVNINK